MSLSFPPAFARVALRSLNICRTCPSKSPASDLPESSAVAVCPASHTVLHALPRDMEESHDEKPGGLGIRSGRTGWASDDSGRNHGSKRGRRRTGAEARLGGVRETDGPHREDRVCPGAADTRA